MARAKRAGSRRGKSAWAEIMSDWARSGLSQAAFCKERGIPYSTFQYWRSRRKAREKWDARSLEPASVPPPFLPVQVVQSRPVAEEARQGLTVLLPGGYRIEVGADFEPEVLRKIISALESVPC